MQRLGTRLLAQENVEPSPSRSPCIVGPAGLLRPSKYQQLDTTAIAKCGIATAVRRPPGTSGTLLEEQTFTPSLFARSTHAPTEGVHRIAHFGPGRGRGLVHEAARS